MKKWYKLFGLTLLVVFFLGGLSGCGGTTTVRTTVHGSVHHPYDYYYYPESRVYFNIATGHYYYPYQNRWKRVRTLPPHFIFERHGRVKLTINTRHPYTRHHVHRTKYVPRRHRHRNRTRVNYDHYYYYPGSRVYFNAATGYYYYPGRRWTRSKRIIPRYHLNHGKRVKVRVKSGQKPYLHHKLHRKKYPSLVKHKYRIKNKLRRFKYRRTY